MNRIWAKIGVFPIRCIPAPFVHPRKAKAAPPARAKAGLLLRVCYFANKKDASQPANAEEKEMVRQALEVTEQLNATWGLSFRCAREDSILRVGASENRGYFVSALWWNMLRGHMEDSIGLLKSSVHHDK